MPSVDGCGSGVTERRKQRRSDLTFGHSPPLMTFDSADAKPRSPPDTVGRATSASISKSHPQLVDAVLPISGRRSATRRAHAAVGVHAVQLFSDCRFGKRFISADCVSADRTPPVPVRNGFRGLLFARLFRCRLRVVGLGRLKLSAGFRGLTRLRGELTAEKCRRSADDRADPPPKHASSPHTVKLDSTSKKCSVRREAHYPGGRPGWCEHDSANETGYD